MPPVGQMDIFLGYQLREISMNPKDLSGTRYIDEYFENGRRKTCCDIIDSLLDIPGNQFSKVFYKHLWEIHHDEKYAPKKKVGNGRHNGLWAGTLTKAPTDPLSESDMISAIKKLMTQQTCPVKRYAWYLEYKEDGLHPHIHFIYETETGGRITQRTFQRQWSIWDEKKSYKDEYGKYKGHRGGYHKEVADEYCYKDYISEDGGLHESQGFILNE